MWTNFALHQQDDTANAAHDCASQILNYVKANIKESLIACQNLPTEKKKSILWHLGCLEDISHHHLAERRYFWRPLHQMKTNVNQLCEPGVLTKINDSEWASPTFSNGFGFLQAKQTSKTKDLSGSKETRCTSGISWLHLWYLTWSKHEILYNMLDSRGMPLGKVLI